jgi:hypothetical protein
MKSSLADRHSWLPVPRTERPFSNLQWAPLAAMLRRASVRRSGLIYAFVRFVRSALGRAIGAGAGRLTGRSV